MTELSPAAPRGGWKDLFTPIPAMAAAKQQEGRFPRLPRGHTPGGGVALRRHWPAHLANLPNRYDRRYAHALIPHAPGRALWRDSAPPCGAWSRICDRSPPSAPGSADHWDRRDSGAAPSLALPAPVGTGDSWLYRIC